MRGVREPVAMLPERHADQPHELRLATPDRPWIATAAAAIVMALVLWILAELAALCRLVRDGQPFAPDNVRRIRRLALALALGEVYVPRS